MVRLLAPDGSGALLGTVCGSPASAGTSYQNGQNKLADADIVTVNP